MGTYDARLTDSGDLALPTTFVRGAELVVQRSGVRLGRHYGEVFLDQFAGLPYLDWVTTKPPPLQAIEDRIVQELSTTPGVLRVVSVSAVVALNDDGEQVVKVEGQVLLRGEEQPDQVAAGFALSVGDNTQPSMSLLMPWGRITPVWL